MKDYETHVFLELINHVALERLPELIEALSDAIGVEVIKVEDDTLMFYDDLSANNSLLYVINIKNGHWQKFTMQRHGEDPISFMESFADCERMEGAVYVAEKLISLRSEIDFIRGVASK